MKYGKMLGLGLMVVCLLLAGCVEPQENNNTSNNTTDTLNNSEDIDVVMNNSTQRNQTVGVWGANVSLSDKNITLIRNGSQDGDIEVLGFNDLSIALMSVETGDVLRLKNGTYRGSFSIEAGVKIVGSNDSRIKPGNYSGPGIMIDTEEHVLISNLEIRGFDAAAVYMSGDQSNVYMSDLVLTNNSFGVRAEETRQEWVLENSTVSGNEKGVYSIRSRDWIVRDSYLVDNLDSGLDSLMSRGEWMVEHNNITGNGVTGLRVRSTFGNGTDGGEPHIKRNNVLNNSEVDIISIGGDPVVLKRNYWGVESGLKKGKVRGYTQVIDPCRKPCSGL